MENPIASMKVLGGRLCLDFANTLDQHVPPLGEYLHGYDDLAWWGVRVGLLAEDEAEALRERARAEPEEAARVFARALALRGAVFRLFSAAAAGRAPGEADMETLNEEWRQAASHLRVTHGADGYAWAWDDARALDRVLRAVARDAAELLTSDLLDRVGECPGHACDWLYLDTSRNRSRRWCDMAGCGNRAKARRHYHRSAEAH
ncbi:MAG TPA: ABATE domain-containing protein [Longimicrobium sp.]|nr:ABATE domain-containing protein [Longimicrobium sp.]